jgi:hypothetical protein
MMLYFVTMKVITQKFIRLRHLFSKPAPRAANMKVLGKMTVNYAPAYNVI